MHCRLLQLDKRIACKADQRVRETLSPNLPFLREIVSGSSLNRFIMHMLAASVSNRKQLRFRQIPTRASTFPDSSAAGSCRTVCRG
jgi:hypothetical protein